MPEKKDFVFKCPNDIKVTIKKDNGGVLFDEECCTSLSIILKNNGEIATSFMGSHSTQIIKALEKAQKIYFKSIKKALKKESNQEDELTLLEKEIPADKKWNNEPVDLPKDKQIAIPKKKENSPSLEENKKSNTQDSNKQSAKTGETKKQSRTTKTSVKNKKEK